MVTIKRLTKKIFQKNRRGGGVASTPPVPARVNPISGKGGLFLSTPRVFLEYLLNGLS